MIQDRVALNAELMAAHARGDAPTLIRIYRDEGEALIAAGDIDAGCFMLTHAYIFALEAGDPQAQDLHKILVTHGREE